MNPKIYFTHFDSPLRSLLLTSNGEVLTGLYLASAKYFPVIANHWQQEIAIAPFVTAKLQLNAYFAGELTAFDLPVSLLGTPFQSQVWSALQTIPYGTTISYGELAQKIGQPQAVRAVGLANSRNPISIIVPCHRVISAKGQLTGYAGGLAQKQWLLNHEATAV